MASATKLQTYENFEAKSEDYYCNAEENDQIYEAVEPVDGTEDTSAKVETNKNLGQGKKHVQPQTVEQMELNFMSEHGANARRTSVSLDMGIKLSRFNRWLGRLLAATCVLSALTIGCWIAIGMLFMQSADGSWGSWSSWSLCSKSCGVGLTHRRRTCNNPEPVAGGKYCDGDPQEFDSCETRTCALNGNWGAWSSWSLCSKSCGVGLKRRRRTCNNSEPVAGGKYCDGDPQEFDSCETRPCAVNGNWGAWSSWSLCSKSCGAGLKRRRRTCNNSEPVAGGIYCDGDPQEFDSCETRTCADLANRNTKVHVSFSARLGETKGYTRSEKLAFKEVLNNDGAAYDSGTGIFTAPANGKYWFSASISVFAKALAHVWIVKNGVNIVEMAPDNRELGGHWETSSASTVMDLTQGDEVYCSWMGGINADGYSVSGGNLNMFSGALLIQN